MKQEKNKNSIEDLLLFYNKYLNVEIGEGFLLELVKKCATTHQLQEISAKDTSIIFNQLELEFLAFHHFKSIELAKDYTIIIDSMGHITNFLFKPGFDLAEKEELKKYINNSIFNFLESIPVSDEQIASKEEVQNMILQNIFVSKISKATYEQIKIRDGLLASTRFMNKNSEIINYEDQLTSELNFEELFANKLIFSRSLR